MLDKIGRGFLSSGNNLHLIPIFLTILLHLRVLPTPDHRITVSNEFADIFRIVPDFQHFQAVAAAEDTISKYCTLSGRVTCSRCIHLQNARLPTDATFAGRCSSFAAQK